MAYEFKLQRRVAFAETDAAGILHFANYFRYMEEAEHAFFRSLGLRVHHNGEGGVLGWVRVDTRCTFEAPLHNEELVDVHLLVREKRDRSLVYDALFRRSVDDTVVARGSLTVVCVTKDDGGRIVAVPMPAEVRAKIDVAPAEHLA